MLYGALVVTLWTCNLRRLISCCIIIIVTLTYNVLRYASEYVDPEAIPAFVLQSQSRC